MQRVITEAHLRNRSKLVVPISVISNSSSPGAEPDTSQTPPAPSPPDPCVADPQLLMRCIDLGAADVIVSPINSKCMTSVMVQAYRAHKEAARERQALLEVRKGRKLSWFGVSEEKPFAYLREAMVSGLMKGLCRLGGDLDDRTSNFKITVSAERQAAIAEAIGHWHFCAHDFADDELIIAALIMFKHALSMPSMEKWRIPTGEPNLSHLSPSRQDGRIEAVRRLSCGCFWCRGAVYANLLGSTQTNYSTTSSFVAVPTIPSFPITISATSWTFSRRHSTSS